MAKTKDDDKILSQHFRVEIKGIGDQPNVRSGDFGKVTIEAVESTQGDEPEHRTYCYGKHTYEDLNMTLQQGPENKPLFDWFTQATQRGGEGGALRRDISVFLYARDKSTILRTYHAKECFPTSLDSGDHSTASEAKTLTLVCKVGYVEVE